MIGEKVRGCDERTQRKYVSASHVYREWRRMQPSSGDEGSCGSNSNVAGDGGGGGVVYENDFLSLSHSLSYTHALPHSLSLSVSPAARVQKVCPRRLVAAASRSPTITGATAPPSITVGLRRNVVYVRIRTPPPSPPLRPPKQCFT